MRRFFAACLLLVITLPCRAQGDKPKPNTLTVKEIADGWILLFDGETTFGWDINGSAKTDDGTLLLGGDKQVEAWNSSYFSSAQIEFEYRYEKKSSKTGIRDGINFWLRGNAVPSNGLGFIPAEGAGWTRCALNIHTDPEDGKLTIDRRYFSPSGSVVHQSANPIGAKRTMKLGFELGAGGSLLLRNIKLRPIETKALFNGTDLAGWKEFPGKKSKFAVVDGAINVKDGPGDLQTVGKYKDFILQLECISNGKHLNSGIFFRCRDNEYQNGYEAQIRNQFTPEATQDYTIEEYDPKTNKLIGKKKIKSTAVDYGTGAIYRRQPARKEMAKDGEWFAMTIVAHGNHLATWVNGVQVTDWHDNRPKSDNARTGCKLEAGHISIQGHDPTTNLSFRNFRIAELPSAK